MSYESTGGCGYIPWLTPGQCCSSSWRGRRPAGYPCRATLSAPISRVAAPPLSITWSMPVASRRPTALSKCAATAALLRLCALACLQPIRVFDIAAGVLIIISKLGNAGRRQGCADVIDSSQVSIGIYQMKSKLIIKIINSRYNVKAIQHYMST